MFFLFEKLNCNLRKYSLKRDFFEIILNKSQKYAFKKELQSEISRKVVLNFVHHGTEEIIEI
jgi:hypothetical protein